MTPSTPITDSAIRAALAGMAGQSYSAASDALGRLITNLGSPVSNDEAIRRIGDVFLMSTCRDIPVDHALFRALARFGPKGPRIYWEDRQRFSKYYGDGHSELDRDNLAHVRRLVGYAEGLAPRIRLTHRELADVSMAMLASDCGKCMSFIRGGFRELAPEEGITDWLREYRIRTGEDLRLALTDMSFHDDFRAASLFYKIVFGVRTKFFPLGLYFHEIPGYALAYGANLPREVLQAIFAHNGPEGAMSAVELGAVGTYTDLTTPEYPFWGSRLFKPIRGPYPLPTAGNKLAILHTMLDRYDQGILIPNDRGSLDGGPRKICNQRISQQDWAVLRALEYALSVVPREAENQIHFLYRHRIANTPLDAVLMSAYQWVVEGLRSTASLKEAIDFEGSREDKIVFKNGAAIERLKKEDPSSFLERIFAQLNSNLSHQGNKVRK